VPRQEIEGTFTDGWVIESVETSRFEVRPDPKEPGDGEGGPKAWIVVVRRAG
jgi:hypothetical protein